MSSVVLVQQVEPLNGPADASDPLVFQGKRMVPNDWLSIEAHRQAVVTLWFTRTRRMRRNPKSRSSSCQAARYWLSRTADLPAPDASGAIPMIVGAATRPGNCQLADHRSPGEANRPPGA